MRVIALVGALAVVLAACTEQAGPVISTRSPSPTAADAVASTASVAPAATSSGQTRFEFVADLALFFFTPGGPVVSPPVEPTCRGRGLLVLDMRRRPPLELVTATFEIEIEDCPEGAVAFDAFVDAYARPTSNPTFRTQIISGITRPLTLTGGSGIVTFTNPGVDPRRAAEVIEAPAGFGFFVVMGPTAGLGPFGAGGGPLRAR